MRAVSPSSAEPAEWSHTRGITQHASARGDGGIPGMVKLLEIKYIEEGVYQAQEYCACTLWHLAGLPRNRELIASSAGIPPLVGMLSEEGELVPRSLAAPADEDDLDLCRCFPAASDATRGSVDHEYARPYSGCHPAASACSLISKRPP